MLVLIGGLLLRNDTCAGKLQSTIIITSSGISKQLNTKTFNLQNLEEDFAECSLEIVKSKKRECFFANHIIMESFSSHAVTG